MTPEQQKALQAARNRAVALQTARDRLAQQQSPVMQAGAGTKEGVAGFLGAPVDLLTSAINARIGQVNRRFPGEDVEQIANPIGGSQSVMGLFEAMGIKDVAAPADASGRYARRIGQEVGFGVPAALTGMRAAGPLTMPQQAGVMVTNTAGDVAAGTAGQTVQEIDPGNDTLDAFASIAAGITPAAMTSKAVRAPARSTQELFDQGRAKKAAAQSSGVTLTPQAHDAYVQQVETAIRKEGATPRLNPKAFAVLEEIRERNGVTTLRDLDIDKSRMGRAVAASPDEAGVGVVMKKANEGFQNELRASDVIGGRDPGDAVANLQSGRQDIHQGYKAAEIEGKQYRGMTRAATSGTGGNEVNTQRQNIRTVLDNEMAPTRSGRRKGYSPDEVAQMERVVMGTPTVNAARWAGRFSPTSGMLPGTLGVAGYSAAGAGAMSNPLMALAAVPPTVGYIAKEAAERATKREIDELLDVIRRGGVMGVASLPDAARARLLSALVSAGDATTP